MKLKKNVIRLVLEGEEQKHTRQEDFKASNRWLDRFKNRNGIKAKCICKNGRGYSRLMEETTSTYFTRMGAIWNMDETAQFFRALPSHVVARAQKDRQSV